MIHPYNLALCLLECQILLLERMHFLTLRGVGYSALCLYLSVLGINLWTTIMTFQWTYWTFQALLVRLWSLKCISPSFLVNDSYMILISMFCLLIRWSEHSICLDSFNLIQLSNKNFSYCLLSNVLRKELGAGSLSSCMRYTWELQVFLWNYQLRIHCFKRHKYERKN